MRVTSSNIMALLTCVCLIVTHNWTGLDLFVVSVQWDVRFQAVTDTIHSVLELMSVTVWKTGDRAATLGFFSSLSVLQGLRMRYFLLSLTFLWFITKLTLNCNSVNGCSAFHYCVLVSYFSVWFFFVIDYSVYFLLLQPFLHQMRKLI